jgi:large subunit ribosomal protein L11
VELTVYQDRSFSFITKTPPASYFLKKAAGLDKAAQTPGRDPVGRVNKAQIREIAEKKMIDLNADDVEAAMKTIMGSARSMGIEVTE